MKAIRWPGLIAFVVFVGVLVGGALLFAESLAKSFLESSLSDLNGAKVDIASVDITYAPLSIAINKLEVADKNQPMTNTVQIGKAEFRLALGDLLLSKLIIDEMSLQGIEIDTARKTSGAITRPKQKLDEEPAAGSSFEMPDIDLPDLTKILQIEPFKTDQLIKSLNEDLDSTKQGWQASYDELTDQARWDALEARYNKIKVEFKGSTAQKIQAIKDAKVLRDDLKKEVDAFKQAKARIKQDSDRLSGEIKAAKDGPKNDIKAIKEKYKIGNLNAGNITQTLFGEQAAQYIALAQKWYQRVKPYLGDDQPEAEPVKRSAGRDVSFKEINPKPGFYVGKAALDVKTARGQFEGKLSDVSSDQSISRKPMRILLAGKDLRNRKLEKITGEVNTIEKDNGHVDVAYVIQAYSIDDFAVSKSSKLAISMERGLMDLTAHARLKNGMLKGEAGFEFSQVRFKSNKEQKGSSLPAMLAASLTEIKRFNIDAKFAGSLNDLDMSLQSDLDKQLGTQLKSRFQQRADQFEKDLRAKVEEKYREPLQKIDEQRQKLRALQDKIDKKEQELTQLKADLDNKIDQQKNLQEQEIKSKADKEKDQLMEKLKNKLFR